MAKVEIDGDSLIVEIEGLRQAVGAQEPPDHPAGQRHPLHRSTLV